MWLAAAIVLIPVVFWLQQYSIGLRNETLRSAPRERTSSEEPTEPGITGFTLSAKVMVRSTNMLRSMHEKDGDPSSAAELDDRAISRVDRLRVAIVAGELDTRQAALDRIATLQKEVDPQGDLARDLTWLQKIYRDGVKDIPDDARRSLVERHGWFGRLALVSDRTDHRGREEIVGGGGRLVAVIIFLVIAALILAVAGLVAGLHLVLAWRRGDIESRFNEAVGGPLYIETFVIFLCGFLLVLAVPIVAFGFNAEATPAAGAISEILLWSLVLALLWPVFRGVPWSRFAWDVGLHKGEGMFKEVWCGVLGYLASIPLVIATVLITVLVQSLAGVQEEKGPTGYPMFEHPPGGTWATEFLMVLSLVVWAPVVEEIIFRGVLYRYLHPRLRWFGAVLATGAVFGFVHPYTASGLVHIAVVGVVLGLIREWRGSLIAPMVVHFLNNGVIALTSILIMAAID